MFLYKLKKYQRLLQYQVLKLLSAAVGIAGGRICPCCHRKTLYYKPYGTRQLRMDAECPWCRGAERDRLEAFFLREFSINSSTRILHFAPERCQYLFFNKLQLQDYWPVDIDPKIDMIRKTEDITALSFLEDFFDLIICNQVLEHVPECSRAISELARVLKKDGVCVITVPIDEEHKTLEEAWIDTDELRIKYYGEANHVRMFGNDFEQILKRSGLNGRKIYAMDLLDRKERRKAGLKKKEYFWLCTK